METLPAEIKNTPEKFLTSKELRMRDAGLTRESAYKKVLEMQSAQVMTLDKFGGEHFAPDNATQLRATEMVLKMTGDIKPDDGGNSHTTGVSGINEEAISGLLNMFKSALDRMEAMKSNGRQTGEIIDVETV